MRVVLLHDYLIRFGGAEKVLEVLSRMFPEAPIFTLLADKNLVDKHFPNRVVSTTILQHLPFRELLISHPRWSLPFLPVAVETMNLRDFDLVVSSSSAFIKGVIVRPQTIHISYIHAPSRFLWDWKEEYITPFFFPKKLFAKLATHYARVWDRQAAERPDHLIANSKATQEKIWKYYRRKAKVIYPPVSIENQKPETRNQKPETDYFLIVSYLTPYKRVDLAVEAFNKLELPLVIIGDGPERKKLEKMAGPSIQFLGSQTDEVVHEYYKNCRALIFPGEDDFGMTAVEAMSYGKPVLAYRKGGVTESVIERVTGEFFDDPIPEILADGVRRLNENYATYHPDLIKKRAEKFSEDVFIREMKEFINQALSETEFRTVRRLYEDNHISQ